MSPKSALPDAWLGDLGERQILLKGRGGVGKTVILLQMAYRAFDQSNQRSIVLTFNKALVADMRRTMSLLGVPRGVEAGGVGIETVHAFIGRIMLKLGVIGGYEGFLEDYNRNKAILLDYLRSGAVTAGDLAELRTVDATALGWDLVFIDEGQDWPGDEIAILNAIYGPRRLVVSDGVDQYVRESVADWASNLEKGQSSMHRLKKCLRMKANVASFVAEVAIELGLGDWDLVPNADAVGGRVVIYEGDLASRPARIAALVGEARELGNFPVDLLACVPPHSVVHTSGAPGSLIAEAYLLAGGKVWDGTARDVREYYPTDREELRFVQYDSCRGLEGWTTVNYDIDKFWNYKVSQWLSEDHAHDPLIESREEAAQQHAARWTMIPLTRAIDTLVINVGPAAGPLRAVFRRVADRRPDFVEWIDLGASGL